jgi:uncharacterized membrane protein YeaQ/YmgE (transglycosylase-associated protein family)
MRKWILLILLVVVTVAVAGPLTGTIDLSGTQNYTTSIAPAAIGAIVLGLIGIGRLMHRRN